MNIKPSVYRGSVDRLPIHPEFNDVYLVQKKHLLIWQDRWKLLNPEMLPIKDETKDNKREFLGTLTNLMMLLDERTYKVMDPKMINEVTYEDIMRELGIVYYLWQKVKEKEDEYWIYDEVGGKVQA